MATKPVEILINAKDKATPVIKDVGAAMDGIAPAAQKAGAASDAALDDRLAAAINFAADQGADIINMSLGGARRPSADRTACPHDEQQAIFSAIDRGAIVFAAAGNRGDQDNAIEEPGVCLGVVSVGAVDRNGNLLRIGSPL